MGDGLLRNGGSAAGGGHSPGVQPVAVLPS
jgi:hypothetical protein